MSAAEKAPAAKLLLKRGQPERALIRRLLLALEWTSRETWEGEMPEEVSEPNWARHFAGMTILMHFATIPNTIHYSLISFTNYFNQHPFFSLAVKLSIKYLLPRAKI